MIIKKYLVAAVLCMGLSSQAFADEKVTNGSFNGFLGSSWSFSNIENRIASNAANAGVVDTILPGSGWLSQTLTLAAGSYKLVFDGLFSGSSNSTLNYSISGLSGALVSAVGGSFGGATGNPISGSHEATFDVATGGTFELLFSGRARGGLLSYVAVDNVSVSTVTAVPGPEAGAGLGALAMGGIAMWARRRRALQSVNA